MGLSLLYQGSTGRSTAAAATLARRGRIAVLDPAGGLKSSVLRRAGIPLDQIELVTPDPVTLKGLTQLAEELRSEANSLAGLLVLEAVVLREECYARLLGVDSQSSLVLRESQLTTERIDHARRACASGLRKFVLAVLRLDVPLVVTTPDPTNPASLETMLHEYADIIVRPERRDDDLVGRVEKDTTSRLPEELEDAGADQIVEQLA